MVVVVSVNKRVNKITHLFIVGKVVQEFPIIITKKKRKNYIFSGKFE